MAIHDLPLAESLPSPAAHECYPEAETRVESEDGDRMGDVLDRLKPEYPPLYCFLDGATPFQLLVAVILSAQCTDEMVNKVTPTLFDHYPTPEALADAPKDHVEELIYSTGFYRNKTEYIQETARIIATEYDGSIPETIDELVELPGVARKTATVILWYAFERIEGITVDTHVLRLSKRLGFTESESAGRVEKDLMEITPQERWPWVTYLFISHGRAICTAQSPDCVDCSISNECPSAFTFE